MVGYALKIWLVICLVVACNSGQVGFESNETTEETVIEDDDNKAKVGETDQEISPVIADRPLDILLVIDNSGSMGPAHESLSGNLDGLIDKVRDSDWRIVITTATFTDCLRAVINKDDPNYESLFTDAIEGLKPPKEEEIPGLDQEKRVEYDLSNMEDTVRMATKALPTVAGSKFHYSLPLRSTETFVVPPQFLVLPYENDDLDKLYRGRPTWCTTRRGTPPAHWLRDKSMLVILLITDEDAFSGDVFTLTNSLGMKVYQTADLLTPQLPPEADPVPVDPHCRCEESDVKRSCKCIDLFWERLTAIRKPRITAKIYGLLSESFSKFYLGWTSDSGENGEKPFGGEKLFDSYSWLYKQKRTENPDPTLADFTTVLEKISTDVALQMNKTYQLNRFHDGGTSKVIFVYADKKTKEQPADSYRIEGRTLVFNESPPTDVKAIKVTFSFKQ